MGTFSVNDLAGGARIAAADFSNAEFFLSVRVAPESGFRLAIAAPDGLKVGRSRLKTYWLDVTTGHEVPWTSPGFSVSAEGCERIGSLRFEHGVGGDMAFPQRGLRWGVSMPGGIG